MLQFGFLSPKLHIKGHILPILILVLPFAQASAYLDPGTGSLLLSSIVAIFASFVYFFKNIFYKLSSLSPQTLTLTFRKNTAKTQMGGGFVMKRIPNI